MNKEKASPDIQIGGCTTVIQSGKETKKNLAIAFNNRGSAYDNNKQYDRAIQDYDQAIKLNPNYAIAFFNRGRAYLNKGQYDHAIQDYDQATKLAPKNASYWNGRCWVRALAGQLDQALKDCDESLRLRPNDAHTLDSLGLVHLKLNDLDKAIADYDAACKVNPKFADALYGRGIAKRKKGDTDGGEADMTAAKAIDAKIVETFAGYGLSPSQATQQEASVPSSRSSAPQNDVLQATQSIDLHFSSWAKTCTIRDSKKICLTTSSRYSDSNKLLAAVTMIQTEGENDWIRVGFPSGMGLPFGTRLIVDQQKPLTAPYVYCEISGCVADYKITTEFLKRLQKATKVVIQGIDMQGKMLSYTVSFAGFAKAYSGPGTDIVVQ